MKTAIVTGSGRGLGAATAKLLAERGTNVVINDVDEKAAQETAKTIGAATQVKTLASKHDISVFEQARALVAETKKTFGSVDILINNAGIIRDSLLLKMTEKDWDDVIRINLKGVFNMSQAAAEAMKETKWGRIVNLASVAWQGNVGQVNYSASKAGVVGMTRTMALELSRYGVTVNAIAPGLIDSDMTQKIPAEVKERMIKNIPAGRMGAPGEVAALIGFLTSDDAAYVTGQCIHIDGGLTTGLRLG